MSMALLGFVLLCFVLLYEFLIDARCRMVDIHKGGVTLTKEILRLPQGVKSNLKQLVGKMEQY